MSYVQRTLRGIQIEAAVHQIYLALQGDGMVLVQVYGLVDHIEICRAITHKQQLSVGNHKRGQIEDAYLMINNTTALSIPDDAQTELEENLRWLCLAEGCAGLVIDELRSSTDGLSAADQEVALILMTSMLANLETPTAAKGKATALPFERIAAIQARVNATNSMQLLRRNGYLHTTHEFI